MANGSTGAVFFLGTRAHYQVLEQPNNYDVENGNTSTETIYENTSVEELWPGEQINKRTDFDANYNTDTLGWNFNDQKDTVIYDRTKSVGCVKRRVKRRSSEALLCDDIKPAALNNIEDKGDSKPKTSRRISLLSFLASLARRKRRMDSDQVQYLQHMECALTSCTYRESCRCLDCQSRYFDCADESDYSSDDDYTPYSLDIESQINLDDDQVFLDSAVDNDNTSTDLLLEDGEPTDEGGVPEVLDNVEIDKQLQMEVAASTSAMFNILLYHPFSCNIQ